MAEHIHRKVPTVCPSCGQTRMAQKTKKVHLCYSCAAKAKPLRSHGMSYTALYRAWSRMLSRVAGHDPKARHRYLDRGITVCQEWREFEPFAEWALANGYAEGLELDRENNDGNYEPGNCRWITHRRNSQNRGNARMMTAFGRTQSLAEWADETGIKYATLYSRVNQHEMAPEQALTHKPHAKAKKAA
jgi:ribosomal protein L37AE/L43A